MNDLNKTARDTGIEILSINPSGEKDFPDYTKYNFLLSVSAPDYDSLAKFVNSLEVSNTVYIVEGLSMEAQSYNIDKRIEATLGVNAVAILN